MFALWFAVGDGYLVGCGGNINMLGDIGCVNYNRFFNGTLLGNG